MVLVQGLFVYLSLHLAQCHGNCRKCKTRSFVQCVNAIGKMIGKFWGGGHGEVIFKDDERTLVFFRLSISENYQF